MFEELQSPNDEPVRFCECGAKAKRTVPLVGLLITQDGFEENNRKAKNPDALHEARMENKRSVEANWHKVESGEATYDPGKTPPMYQPRQYREIQKKHF